MVTLRGITWEHDRGYKPLHVTEARYHEIHPDITVAWEKRTLKQFGDLPIDELAPRYDLLVIDHPFVGIAAVTNCLIPLDNVLPLAYLELQAEQSAGSSFHSYTFCGHQWAVAIDAAAQVSAYRPDLISRTPSNWEDVLRLARESSGTQQPKVALPLFPADAFCTFLTLCANRGEPAYNPSVRSVSTSTAVDVLSFLRKLSQHIHSDSFQLNPPKTLERMSDSDEIAYVPILFGYSNYSRSGYRSHTVLFCPIPSYGYGPIGSTLGGAGLAISAECQYIREAADYTMWTSQADVQRTLYFEAGGQPGNRVAWLDSTVNGKSGDFFRRTWESMFTAYVRPGHGYFPQMQEEGGSLIGKFLQEGGQEPEELLRKLDAVFAEARNLRR